MKRHILHVLGSMDRGGVETWIMNVLRNIDRREYQIDFLVHTDREAAYDAEIVSRGSHIYAACNPRNPVRYSRRFSEVLKNYGPFDAVHSHVYWYSGFVLRLAHGAGIPIRIAHSHTATSNGGPKVSGSLYRWLMRRWILRYSTHRIGISRVSAEALFGEAPEEGFDILHYGLDFSRFDGLPEANALKQSLSIPLSRKVIGHVGRFAPMKNHVFILNFFELMLADGADAHLLFVGDGPLLPVIQAETERRGLADRCTFAGLQQDVAPFFSVMDVSVFPSTYEGLGIAAVESQAAGVPVVVSDAIPEEINVIPELVDRVALSTGASGWAEAVGRRCRDGSVRNGNEARTLGNSRFALRKCMDSLVRIYQESEITSGVPA